jgi:hypothetical protein
MFPRINLLKFVPNAMLVFPMKTAAEKVWLFSLSKIGRVNRKRGAEINISFFGDSATEKSHSVFKSSTDVLPRPQCRRRKRRVIPLSCSKPGKGLVAMRISGLRRCGPFVPSPKFPSSANAGAVWLAGRGWSL